MSLRKASQRGSSSSLLWPAGGVGKATSPGTRLLLLLSIAAVAAPIIWLRGEGWLATSSGPGPGAELVNVQVVFRHGARTPLTDDEYAGPFEWACDERYPGAPRLDMSDALNPAAAPPPLSDPATPRLRGGCPQGTLTQRGYRMARDLGAELRRRYIHDAALLPQAHAPGSSSLYAFSTNFRRTRATLQGVLSGLYPGAEGLPVDAVLDRRAFMYGSNETCAALAPIQAALRERADARERGLPPEIARGVRGALNLTEAQLPAPVDWHHLRDVMAAVVAERPGARPAGLDDATSGVISARAVHWDTAISAPGRGNCLATLATCRAVIRLSIGPLLWRLLNNMEAGVAAAAGGGTAGASDKAAAVAAGGGTAGASDKAAAAAGQAPATGAAGGGAAGAPRVFLYSGHDSTLHALMVALGYPPEEWVPFASDLALELWRGANGRAWVRALLSGAPLALRARALPRRRQELRGGGPSGAARRAPDGWIQLPKLRHRLGRYAVSDEEKDRLCWPQAASP